MWFEGKLRLEETASLHEWLWFILLYALTIHFQLLWVV